jgi:hypothetical protein
VVAEEEASTAVVAAAFTAVAVAGAFTVAGAADPATVAVESIEEEVPTEVRDLSTEEVLTEAEAFAADHLRTTSEPAEVPMADSADRAA